MLQRPAQPGARERPVELDGPYGAPEQRGGLLHRAPREVAKLDHAGLARLTALQLAKPFVQRQDFFRGYDPLDPVVEWDACQTTPVTHREVPTCALDQDATDGFGRDEEEV